MIEMNDVWASDSDDEANNVPNKNNRTGSSRLLQRSKSAASVSPKRPFSSNSNYLKEYKNLIINLRLFIMSLFLLNVRLDFIC